MIADLTAKTSIVKFKVITEAAFANITSLFADLKSEMQTDFSGFLVECLYEIRVGDYTYSGPSSEEFEKQYKKKHRADNIRLLVQASDPRQQLNPVKSRVTLVLDRAQESSLSVVGTNNNWVNGVFTRFNEIFANAPTRNVILHNVVFEMGVQLLAVSVMTIFSIFAANRLATQTEIEFSEVYIFIVIWLLLSNLWSYAARGLTAIRGKYYPVVDIIRVPRKPVFLTMITFVLLAAATWAVNYLLNLLLLSKNGP